MKENYERDIYNYALDVTNFPYLWCTKVVSISAQNSAQDLLPEKVIFNDPATIVFWNDGSKTVVKAQPGEIFDKEKGLAMAFAKKASGNKGHYNEVFKKFGAVEHSEQGYTVHWVERFQDGDPKKDGSYLVALSYRKDTTTMQYSVREGWRSNHICGNMDDMVVAWAEMPPKFTKM